jgi:hypothetical protein
VGLGLLIFLSLPRNLSISELRLNPHLKPIAFRGLLKAVISTWIAILVSSKGEEVSEAKIKYLIHYRLKGEGVPSAQDVEAFAAVNGAYHAWPFVRELIFSLTSRMGFQGFTLPVLSFHNPKQNKSEPSAAQKDTDSRETRTT